MKRFVPLQLTHLIEDGEDPPNLSWKDLGPLRILGVTQEQGNVKLELGCDTARVVLVADKDGIRLHRDGNGSDPQALDNVPA